MAHFSHNLYKVYWVLVLLCALDVTSADSEDTDGITVEVEEEDEYKSPQVDPKNVYLAEHFDDLDAFNKRWVRSEAKKQGVDENIAKYDGIWQVQAPNRKIFKEDLGLVLTTEAKHAAISALLDRPFNFDGKPLIVQYEVTMQEGQNCGGAYIKLLSKGVDSRAELRRFHDQTPYTIMFGPDKCGNDNKLHFIFRHTNPKNGTVEEKHSKKPSQRLDDMYKDKEPHLYTLIVRPDNSFSVLVDEKEVNSGSLLEDFTPPVNPPEEIDDPNDKKPEDWDDREKIVDPTATKPEEWDEEAPATIADPNAAKPDGWLDAEPEMIPDPDAVKPADWDEDMDGEWEAPLVDNPRCAAAPGCGPWAPPTIPNPNYKGPWRAPLVANPNYRGKWAPRRVPNPHYFNEPLPYRMTPIHAVGFELWSMSPQLLFDNLLVTDEPAVAELWAQQSFRSKRAKMSRDSESFVERALQTAGDHPWLSGAGALAAFALLGLAAYACCGPRADPEGEMKKSDAVMEDDAAPSEGEDEARGGGERPTGKASLEDTQPETETEAAPEPETETEIKTPQETTPPVDLEGAGDGQARKRKPRKE